MEKGKNNNKDIKVKKPKLKIPIIDLVGSYYSNGVRMSYSPNEFFLDFFQFPAKDNGKMDGMRVFMHPVNFKQIIELFVEQLENYEKQFGKIEIPK